MSKGYRQGRMGEEVRRVMSEMLRRDIKDPRLNGFVSISAVEVTPDGSVATCYVTILGPTDAEEPSPEEKEEVLSAFRKAKGVFKKEIGQQIKMRRIPDLLFKLDTSMEYGRKMSRVLDQLGLEKEDEE